MLLSKNATGSLVSPLMEKPAALCVFLNFKLHEVINPTIQLSCCYSKIAPFVTKLVT